MMISLEELSRLDQGGAMDLLFAYTTDIKRHEKDIEALKKDAALWASRVSLAESRGMAELAAGAKAQLSGLEARLGEIQAAKAELERDAARIKEALPGIKARERSIDPDQLQAELSMMTGEALDPEKARLERELKTLVDSPSTDHPSTDDPLAALKKKMGLVSEAGKEGGEDSPGKGD